MDQLPQCLGRQAAILRDRGAPGGSLALLRDQERICRELGDSDGLTESLTNQAILLALALGRVRDAIPLAEEALLLADSHEMDAHSRNIRRLIDHIKGA